MTEPTSVVAGDTIAWTTTLTSYPAPTWTLKYSFMKDGKSFVITCTASGSDHAFAVTATNSAVWEPGTYVWTSFASSGASRYTVSTGSIDVLPDPAGVTYDPRSVAKVMLDNIDAYLSDPNNLAASSYSIGGRSLSRWSRSELLVERDRLKAEVQSEAAVARIAAGLGNPRRLYVRFDRG